MQQVKAVQEIVSFSVMVKSSVYGDDLASFRSDVMSAVSAILGSDRYYYYTTNYVAEENGYFAIYFVKEIA